MTMLSIPTARVYQPLLNGGRYLGAYGGRGSGKSQFFAGMAIERCLMQKTDMVCLREVQKSLKFSVHKLLAETIKKMNAGAYFEVQDKRIKNPHGGITIFEGMSDKNADDLKSLEGFDIAWFEEAQNASARSLDLLRPTMRKPGSEMWFGWNPRFATDPIEQLLRGPALPSGAIVVEANYTDNPWFPQELREEMEFDRKRDIDKFNHIWRGQYQQHSKARVFNNWRVEEFELPVGTVFRLGADWGFAVDPSVLIRCAIVGNALYVDAEAYQVGCEIVDLPELFMSVPDAEKWPITADSSRPETISHMQRHGFPKITKAVKGPGSLEDGIEFLKSFDIIVHPNCTHTIDELTAYQYKTDPYDDSKVLPVLKDKDNHVIDALRYACEGARRAARVKPKPVFIEQPEEYMGDQGWMQ